MVALFPRVPRPRRPQERGEDQGSEGFDVRNRLEPMMAGLGGPGSQLGGGGGALLEKSKLEFKQVRRGPAARPARALLLRCAGP